MIIYKHRIKLKVNGEEMHIEYEDLAKKLKAISDPKRLQIIDMLSCGELCACVMLEYFNITQPTLSHHMKILNAVDLVGYRKEGKYIYYSINGDIFDELRNSLETLYKDKEDCPCHCLGK